MKSIPAEILVYIFRLLYQNDKLQCIQVCHEWGSIIKSTVLFETLSISSKEGFDSVISAIQQEPSLGTQVNRLLFQVKTGIGFDITILPKLFPNVQDCYITDEIRLKPSCFDPWHNKLKMFFGGSYMDLGEIFISKTWSNLTTLELFGESSDTVKFLDTLTNTPAVKYLKLWFMRFSMDDFEFIHSTLPSLNSLTLEDVKYISTRPPKDIVPASSVTSLSIAGINVNDDVLYRKMLLLYILQKYPNLSELSFITDLIFEYEEPGTEYPRDEWDKLLMGLDPHLQKFHIQLSSIYEYTYVLRALDKSGCQLKSLTLDGFIRNEIVNLLPTLNQSRHLQSLTLMDCVDYDYKQLGSMNMLTELRLGSFVIDESINFTDVLSMCGENLESLKITNVVLECPTITQNVTAPVFHQLKRLELNDVHFPANIGTFISWSFPQLHTLSTRKYFERSSKPLDPTKEGLYIMIPNINLRHLQVIDSFGPDHYVLVMTLCNNEKRLYTTKSGNKAHFGAIEDSFGLRDNPLFPPTVSMEHGKKLVTPIMTITCNSLENIFLGGI